MASYLTLARAKEQIPNTPAEDDVLLQNIVDASCNTVENYLRRKLAKQTYVERMNGTGTRSLFLYQSPVSQISSIRTGRQPGLYVQNNAPSGSVQASLVECTDTSLLLTQITNAVTYTANLDYADYPTIPLLRDAVNAVGHDWNSFSPPIFDTWGSADLQYAQPRGAFSARNLTVNLHVYYWYLYEWRMNVAGTEEDLAEVYYSPGWQRGEQNYLVEYTAGFDPIPEELLTATAELAKVTYLARALNPNLQSESLGQYSYAKAANDALKMLSPASWQTLNHYKITRIGEWHA